MLSLQHNNLNELSNMLYDFKKYPPEEIILFHFKRNLTEEEQTKGIVLNEHLNVSTGIDIIDTFSALVRSLGWADLNDFAKIMNLSPANLNVVIKVFTGCTVKKWVDHYMLLGTYELLAKSNMSINDVSAKLGFTHASVFSRFCKKHTKLSPSDLQWRLRKRKSNV
jgi:AraC-type DNA-binding domain-containing proteins